MSTVLQLYFYMIITINKLTVFFFKTYFIDSFQMIWDFNKFYDIPNATETMYNKSDALDNRNFNFKDSFRICLMIATLYVNDCSVIQID